MVDYIDGQLEFRGSGAMHAFVRQRALDENAGNFLGGRQVQLPHVFNCGESHEA
jgi:hypothetical protein